ncbi:MAG: hypothetical protein IIW42_05975 [Bacteroidaceae bacterium]|nr:hypothetical protein [Bacteroidaceae bacterium]
MAGFVNTRVGTGALRISMNRGAKGNSTKNVVIDGSAGSLFESESLARILGVKIAEDLDDRVIRMGAYIIESLRGAPEARRTALAASNWQISRVRSARSVGHLSRLIYPADVAWQNQRGWQRQSLYGWRYREDGTWSEGGELPLAPPSAVGITDFVKNYSTANGDYGFIITNNVPWARKMVYGNSSTKPLLPVEAIVLEAIEDAKHSVHN